MYASDRQHTDAARISASHHVVIELAGKCQETLLNLSTISNEIESVTKFVEDYWNTTDNEKQLALGKLTRIVNRLKILRQ